MCVVFVRFSSVFGYGPGSWLAGVHCAHPLSTVASPLSAHYGVTRFTDCGYARAGNGHVPSIYQAHTSALRRVYVHTPLKE